MEQTVSPTPNERIKMTTYELWRDVRVAMQEREALTMPRKASRR